LAFSATTKKNWEIFENLGIMQLVKSAKREKMKLCKDMISEEALEKDARIQELLQIEANIFKQIT
jgi:hypothetical protein